jgi:hypothetical protein
MTNPIQSVRLLHDDKEMVQTSSFVWFLDKQRSSNPIQCREAGHRSDGLFDSAGVTLSKRLINV